jgi:hypothetical protein
MVYAPRDELELKIVLEIIRAAAVGERAILWEQQDGKESGMGVMCRTLADSHGLLQGLILMGPVLSEGLDGLFTKRPLRPLREQNGNDHVGARGHGTDPNHGKSVRRCVFLFRLAIRHSWRSTNPTYDIQQSLAIFIFLFVFLFLFFPLHSISACLTQDPSLRFIPLDLIHISRMF